MVGTSFKSIRAMIDAIIAQRVEDLHRSDDPAARTLGFADSNGRRWYMELQHLHRSKEPVIWQLMRTNEGRDNVAQAIVACSKAERPDQFLDIVLIASVQNC